MKPGPRSLDQGSCHAPAFGLRAGGGGFQIAAQTHEEIAMTHVRNVIVSRSVCGILAVLVCVFSPPVALAGGSVRGHGEVPEPGLSPSQISVDAWLDDNGVAHGTMTWVGDVVPGHPGGPADPWLIDVQDIVFDGNTAYVFGVVAHSVFPADIGFGVFLAFTDNSGTGEPDEINFTPIVAGNITVDD